MTKAPRFEREDFHMKGWDHKSIGEMKEECAKVANQKIEKWLEGSVEVTGYLETEDGHMLFGKGIDDEVTHRAWLVGIEAISRGVTKDEIVKILHAHTGPLTYDLNVLVGRIEREGIVG